VELVVGVLAAPAALMAEVQILRALAAAEQGGNLAWTLAVRVIVLSEVLSLLPVAAVVEVEEIFEIQQAAEIRVLTRTL
jgi:hypothetical protein